MENQTYTPLSYITSGPRSAKLHHVRSALCWSSQPGMLWKGFGEHHRLQPQLQLCDWFILDLTRNERKLLVNSRVGWLGDHNHIYQTLIATCVGMLPFHWFTILLVLLVYEIQMNVQVIGKRIEKICIAKLLGCWRQPLYPHASLTSLTCAEGEINLVHFVYFSDAWSTSTSLINSWSTSNSLLSMADFKCVSGDIPPFFMLLPLFKYVMLTASKLVYFVTNVFIINDIVFFLITVQWDAHIHALDTHLFIYLFIWAHTFLPYEHLQEHESADIEIDEVTTCISLSTCISPTTDERIKSVKF